MKGITVFVDGSSRGNPGPAGIGIAVFDADGAAGSEPVFEYSKRIGVTTNNVAEYEALIFALKFIIDKKPEKATVKLDSELVYRQVMGEYRIKTRHIVNLVNRARNLLCQAKNLSLVLVARQENGVANRLAQAASKNAGPAVKKDAATP